MAKREKPALIRVNSGDKMQTVRADVIRPPVAPQSVLTQEQLACARRLYDRVGRLTTMEKRKQWAEGFSMNMHPDKELKLWMVIAEVYERVSPEFLDISEEDKAIAVSKVISRFVDVAELCKVPQALVDRIEELLHVE